MKKTSTITLAGRTFQVEIRDGQRLIEGLSIDDFIAKLVREGFTMVIEDAAQIGRDSLNGTLPADCPQVAAHMLEAARSKRN